MAGTGPSDQVASSQDASSQRQVETRGGPVTFFRDVGYAVVASRGARDVPVDGNFCLPKRAVLLQYHDRRSAAFDSADKWARRAAGQPNLRGMRAAVYDVATGEVCEAPTRAERLREGRAERRHRLFRSWRDGVPILAGMLAVMFAIAALASYIGEPPGSVWRYMGYEGCVLAVALFITVIWP
jgi:hypothetical protein